MRMKRILRPIFLLTCLVGNVFIGAQHLRDVSTKFGFGAAVGIGLMALGLFVVLGAIAIKQILRRRDTHGNFGGTIR